MILFSKYFNGEIRKIGYLLLIENNYIELHHNFFITLLLVSRAKTVSAKNICNSLKDMYILYRKITINGHFSI